MNTNILTASAIAAFAWAPAAAASDATSVGGSLGDAGSTQIQISVTFDRIDDLVQFGQAPGALVDELSSLLEQLPATESLRARLKGHVDDFAARAARTYVGQSDVAVLRTEFVLARIDSFMDDLKRRSIGGGWSAEEFQNVVEGWTQRGRVFVDAPDPAALRARFSQAVQTAVDGSRTFAQAHARVAAIIANERARYAKGVLEARLANGTADKSDYERLMAVLMEARQQRADGAAIGRLD
ncbi:MAG: hypothetical protein AAGA20_06755 [Planctomycetota bacterium]